MARRLELDKWGWTARKAIRMKIRRSLQSLRRRNDRRLRSRTWKRSSASMRRCGNGFLVVRLRRPLATRLREVRLLLDRISRTRAEGKARAVEAEIIGRRGIHLQPRTSRDISTIRPVLPNRMHHRIYQSESASRETGVIQKSNLLRSSHCAALEDLMQAGEAVLDLAIEAHEQAKVTIALTSPLPRPCG